jgi:hypothetical protein
MKTRQATTAIHLAPQEIAKHRDSRKRTVPINALAACALLTLFTSNPGAASEMSHRKKSVQQKAMIEGVVRDSAGKPLKGVKITVDQGTYTTYGSTLIIPIIGKNTIGVVGLNFPDDVHEHVRSAHHTRTDKNGSYKFKVRPGSYNISVNDSHNGKLLRNLTLPLSDGPVLATVGEPGNRDFVFGARE